MTGLLLPWLGYYQWVVRSIKSVPGSLTAWSGGEKKSVVVIVVAVVVVTRAAVVM